MMLFCIISYWFFHWEHLTAVQLILLHFLESTSIFMAQDLISASDKTIRTFLHAIAFKELLKWINGQIGLSSIVRNLPARVTADKNIITLGMKHSEPWWSTQSRSQSGSGIFGNSWETSCMTTITTTTTIAAMFTYFYLLCSPLRYFKPLRNVSVPPAVRRGGTSGTTGMSWSQR